MKLLYNEYLTSHNTKFNLRVAVVECKRTLITLKGFVYCNLKRFNKRQIHSFIPGSVFEGSVLNREGFVMILTDRLGDQLLSNLEK